MIKRKKIPRRKENRKMLDGLENILEKGTFAHYGQKLYFPTMFSIFISQMAVSME